MGISFRDIAEFIVQAAPTMAGSFIAGPAGAAVGAAFTTAVINKGQTKQILTNAAIAFVTDWAAREISAKYGTAAKDTAAKEAFKETATNTVPSISEEGQELLWEYGTGNISDTAIKAEMASPNVVANPTDHLGKNIGSFSSPAEFEKARAAAAANPNFGGDFISGAPAGESIQAFESARHVFNTTAAGRGINSSLSLSDFPTNDAFREAVLRKSITQGVESMSVAEINNLKHSMTDISMRLKAGLDVSEGAQSAYNQALTKLQTSDIQALNEIGKQVKDFAADLSKPITTSAGKSALGEASKTTGTTPKPPGSLTQFAKDNAGSLLMAGGGIISTIVEANEKAKLRESNEALIKSESQKQRDFTEQQLERTLAFQAEQAEIARAEARAARARGAAALEPFIDLIVAEQEKSEVFGDQAREIALNYNDIFKEFKKNNAKFAALTDETFGTEGFLSPMEEAFRAREAEIVKGVHGERARLRVKAGVSGEEIEDDLFHVAQLERGFLGDRFNRLQTDRANRANVLNAQVGSLAAQAGTTSQAVSTLDTANKRLLPLLGSAYTAKSSILADSDAPITLANLASGSASLQQATTAQNVSLANRGTSLLANQVTNAPTIGSDLTKLGITLLKDNLRQREEAKKFETRLGLFKESGIFA